MEKDFKYEHFLIPKSLPSQKIVHNQVNLLPYQRRYNNNLKREQMQNEQLLSPQRLYQMTFEIQKRDTQKMIDNHILSRWNEGQQNKHKLQIPHEKRQIQFSKEIFQDGPLLNLVKPNVDEIVAIETRKMLSPNYSPMLTGSRPKSAVNNTTLRIGKKKMQELNSRQTKETLKLFEMTNFSKLSSLKFD